MFPKFPSFQASQVPQVSRKQPIPTTAGSVARGGRTAWQWIGTLLMSTVVAVHQQPGFPSPVVRDRWDRCCCAWIAFSRDTKTPGMLRVCPRITIEAPEPCNAANGHGTLRLRGILQGRWQRLFALPKVQKNKCDSMPLAARLNNPSNGNTPRVTAPLV